MSEKSPIDLYWGKWCYHVFSAILDQILFILADNDGIYKSLDEFEIRPDPIRDHRVSCSSASKKRCCPFSRFTVVFINEKSQVSVYRTIGPLVFKL